MKDQEIAYRKINEEKITNRFRNIENRMKKLRPTGIFEKFSMFLILSPFLLIILLFFLLYLDLFVDLTNLTNLTSYIMELIPNYFKLIFYLFIILIVVFSFINITPLILVTFISYKRTRYNGFLKEGLIELQSLIYPIFLFIVIIFFFEEIINNNSGRVFSWSFLNIMLLGHSTFLISLQHKFVKKPLIWGSISNTKGFKFLNIKNSDIIMKQSLFVEDFADGYSPRPVFKSISDIFNKNMNKNDIRTIFSRYILFLSLNGDLIGYDKNEHNVTLYLRTSLFRKIQIINSKLIYTKFIQIIKKQNLTSLSINLKTLEIYFKLNKYDYAVLGDITYHQLSEQVLTQFKLSIKEFMDKNYLNAYYCLNPKDLPKVKNNRFLNERDRKFVTYIIATYTVGLIIFLPVMVYLNLGQWLNYGFPILLLILFWPLVLYAYPQAIHNFYSGNLDLIFSYELSVIFLLLISLVLTIIISYLLSPKIFHYIENRENSESKNWLKIPSWE